MPAKAGIHASVSLVGHENLDSGLRRNDGRKSRLLVGGESRSVLLVNALDIPGSFELAQEGIIDGIFDAHIAHFRIDLQQQLV